MHVLYVYALKLLSGFFGTRSGLFDEDKLATLAKIAFLLKAKA